MPKIVANDGCHIFYEVYGKGEPVVFITGFNADHVVWLETAKVFAEKYQAIVIDNRGSGRSDSPDKPYTIEMMAEDVVLVCKHLQLTRCHFMGLSMGGAILQTLAFKHPELVRSAILCNTFTKIDIRFALFAQSRLEFFGKNLSERSMVKNTIGWAFSSAYLSQPGIVDVMLEMAEINPYPMTEIGYRNQLHALLAFDSTNWVHQIKVPCLVVGSDQDMIVSEEHMRQLAKAIPQAQYQHFSGSGHIPPVEQPEAFNKVAHEFLAKY